ncbi:unnamed protein product [Paramecium octaurelia]|uniref:Uncharacterized protein n=1 Tax=Paramecium octaurelia TaxID=43137 RepID=A0A8S1XJ80_PAROT|nr:unnamed protein product [Paramecium octaurelia]
MSAYDVLPSNWIQIQYTQVEKILVPEPLFARKRQYNSYICHKSRWRNEIIKHLIYVVENYILYYQSQCNDQKKAQQCIFNVITNNQLSHFHCTKSTSSNNQGLKYIRYQRFTLIIYEPNLTAYYHRSCKAFFASQNS